MIAVTCLVFGCKEDCDKKKCPEGYIAVEDGKKCICELIPVKEDTRDFIATEFSEVSDLKAQLEQAQKDGIKNSNITFSKPMVTPPDGFEVWREFGKLKTSFPAMNLTFTQKGLICPRDDNSPLTHAEWKSWWFSETQKVDLGINPWSGARWLVDANNMELFLRDGCDPNQFREVLPDTAWFETSSISSMTSQYSNVTSAISSAKQNKGDFVNVDITGDLATTFVSSETSTIKNYANLSKNEPADKFKLNQNGHKVVPANEGITVTADGVFALDPFEVGASQSGYKFTISGDTKDSLNLAKKYNVPSIFNIVYKQNDIVIDIKKSDDIATAIQTIQANVNKPRTNITIKISSDAKLTAAKLANLHTLRDLIENNANITLQTGAGGKIWPGDARTSIDADDINYWHSKGYMGITTESMAEYWDVADWQNISSFSGVVRTGSVSTMTWASHADKVLPDAISINSAWNVSNIASSSTYKNLPWQITLNQAAGGSLRGVNGAFFGMVATPTSPNANARFQATSNVNWSNYSSTAYNTTTVDGLNITRSDTIYFGTGNRMGEKLLETGREKIAISSTYRPERQTLTSHVLKIETNNPNFKTNDGKVIVTMAFIEELLQTINIRGPNRLELSNLYISFEGKYEIDYNDVGPQNTLTMYYCSTPINCDYGLTVPAGKMAYGKNSQGYYVEAVKPDIDVTKPAVNYVNFASNGGAKKSATKKVAPAGQGRESGYGIYATSASTKYADGFDYSPVPMGKVQKDPYAMHNANAFDPWAYSTTLGRQRKAMVQSKANENVNS